MSLALAGGKHGGYGGHGDRKRYHGGSSGYKSGKEVMVIAVVMVEKDFDFN